VLLSEELDEKIRRSEIEGIRCGIEAVRRLYPEECADSIEVCGGLVAFTGVGSPLSQAYGVGTVAHVTDDDVRRITEFYESRNATPRIFVTPMANPTLGRALAAAGYAPLEYESALVCDDFSYGLRDERIGFASDLAAWACASAEAFMDRETLRPDDDRIALILASSRGVCVLEARDDDTIAATAAMDVRGESSALFAGSTKPDFRGRGWHTALVRDRIARARDAGARFLRATAKPASISERNFRRCGFVTLYTRALWERKAQPAL
jgi:GNAT superfamily N-acetyltransferase